MPRRGRWIDALVNKVTGAGAQSSETLFPGVGQEDLRNATIVRTVASLWLASTTVAGAWGTGTLDLGMGIISQDSIAASVFPDPNDADDYPVRGWLFRERCGVFQNGTGTGIFTRCAFDVRSQRKLDTGQYYLVLNNATQDGTAFSVRTSGSVRTLVLLP